jgi:multimeric flavodoxin WrbA
MNVLAISSSPRLDGNSRILAGAVLEGAAEAGNETELFDLSGTVTGLLRDCRTCRGEDGRCTITDGYERLFLDKLLSADGIVLATPLYWYGVSGALKNFIDRIFCFISASYPDSEQVNARLPGKRMAAVLSAEESYVGATFGVEGSMQELARYLHWDLVGIVRGIGNKRGEVVSDPARPLDAARTLGRRLFDARVTDYRLDTVRAGAVWGGTADPE